MYAVGCDHPHRDPSIALLEAVATGQVEAATNAEVLQELLHRYRRLVSWEQAAAIYDNARRLVPTVLPVTGRDLDRARKLIEQYPELNTRDSVHAAIALGSDVELLCTWDGDFAAVRELDSSTPAEVLSSL